MLPVNSSERTACTNSEVIIAVLRECEPARMSNFSLMEEDDYALLAREVVKDFPYLTIEELRDTMMLGIKGKLDAYKNRPVNFTRIYQWVEKNAPQSTGYWRTLYPELLAWADLTGLTERLKVKLLEYHARALPTPVSLSVVRTDLHGLIAYNQLTGGWANRATHGEFTPLLDQFKAAYPEFVARHHAFLF